MYKNSVFRNIAVCLFFLSALLCSTQAVCSESTNDNYVIGSEDSLSINVWENGELSTHVQVRPDGKISIPLLDEIQAEGLTPLQLKEVITKRLESYVQNPKVTVIVSGIKNYTVYFQRGMGGVGGAGGIMRGGGSYVFRKKATLWDLLTRIGSLSPTVALRKAFILRNNVKLPVDLYLLWIKKDLSQNVPLKPNDTLVVPNNYASRINVMGEVGRPQIIPYREGMRIMDALVAVGGLTADADEKRIIITRKVAGEKVHLKINVGAITQGGEPVFNLSSGASKNIELMPGDIIIAREWFFSVYRCLFFPY